MGCVTDKIRWSKGLTLLEMVIAIAIMAIIFSAVLPPFRNISNSWASKQGNAEVLQNGRVLVDYLNRNLAKAVKVTAVSDSSETDGYIEFEDKDGITWRCDIAANNYVEFGAVGDLSDLAGPVSSLRFTCYGLDDLDTAITDVDSIRFIRIEATMVNSSANGQDKSFTTKVYIRTGSGETISSGTPHEFDTIEGRTPALSQIDSTHYLCAYTGSGDDGWATILTVNTETWTITKGTPFEFDADKGKTPALAQIDSTHYLCAYEGGSGGNPDNGWATILTVNTGSWTITNGTPFEFDTDKGKTPALAQIDSTHYLCAYEGGPGGNSNDGWATILTVNTGTWTITNGTPFEFDTVKGNTPALSQIDSTNYLCAYTGGGDDGWATVLTVNTGTWTITNGTPFEFDDENATTPALAKIDSTHYLLAYSDRFSDGWATILTVNTGTWTITNGTPFEFDANRGRAPALSQINSTNYLCAYEGGPGGDSDDGWVKILTVNTGAGTVTEGSSLEFDTVRGKTPALTQIDSTHYLCIYDGNGDAGWALVLNNEIRP